MPCNPNYAVFRFLLGHNNFNIYGLSFYFSECYSFLVDVIGKKLSKII